MHFLCIILQFQKYLCFFICRPDQQHHDIFSVQDMENNKIVDAQEESELIEDFDEDFNRIIEQIDANDCEHIVLPEKFDIQDIKKEVKCKKLVTPVQREINEILDRVDMCKFEKFCKQEFSYLSSLINEIKPKNSKTLGDFDAKCHQHNTGIEYRMNSLKLFDEEKFTDIHMQVCYDISVEIRTRLLTSKADEISQTK